MALLRKFLKDDFDALSSALYSDGANLGPVLTRLEQQISSFLHSETPPTV